MGGVETWDTLKKTIATERASLSYVDSFERMMKRKTGMFSFRDLFFFRKKL